jgi:hypothetical protein
VGTPNPRSMCARKVTVSLVPSVGNTSLAASLQPTSYLGFSRPHVAKLWICSSTTVNGSQMLYGGGVRSGAISSSSTPVDLALNTTSDFVHMRWHAMRRV